MRRVPIFSGLTVQQQDLVAAAARPVHLARGDLVHTAGDSSGQMSVVHSGRIKLSRTMPSGHRRLLRVAGPGETLGEHAVLSAGQTTEEAEALTEAQMCVFRRDDLNALITQYPDIAVRMLRTLADRLVRTERDLALSTLSVDVRVADLLLQLPTALRGPGVEISSSGGADRHVRLPLSKKDVASLLGTTPESLSRALRRLQDRGLISADDDVVALLDLVGLEAMIAEA